MDEEDIRNAAPDPQIHGSDADEPGADDPPDTNRWGKYVYCIIETTESLALGPIGLGEEGKSDVYTIHHGDLAAVVSDTPMHLYDPTRENLLSHELVNETVMKHHTVIPMSFGTIFRTEEDVAELLHSTKSAFRDVLDQIRGKIELGLKVIWDRDQVVEQIEEEHEEIAALRKEIAEATHGSTYFARMQLGRLVETALEERAEQYVSEIYERLKPLAVATRSGKLIGDTMVMNAAFLVDCSREEAFDSEVRALNEQYQDVLDFQYTGPWPPYNFVNITLELERADS